MSYTTFGFGFVDDDTPFFDTDPANPVDYRKNAIDNARELAKTYCDVHVIYNGTYYTIVIGNASLLWWKRKGYKVIHTENPYPRYR